MRAVTSWGRLRADLYHTVDLTDPSQIAQHVCGSSKPGLAHGMGRSYGDVGLNPYGTLWVTTGLDHFMAFDEATGILVCESGVLLRDIQRMALPRGWMLPVTPGTQMVTVGGAIANDVHGKNHHAQGTFGHHVQSLTLQRCDGEVIVCGPHEHADWFAATVGGLGLTGVITQASLQLKRVPGPWFDTQTTAYANVQDFFTLADEAVATWEHTVSWVDCTAGQGGRGLFMSANPSPSQTLQVPAPRQIRMPFVPPVSLMNRYTLRPLNTAYYYLKKWQPSRSVMHYVPFFYPLDNVLEWNRLYGRLGFYQYQCVLPRQTGHDAVHALLAEITRTGEGSFLAVLKTFGARQPMGMLSFVQEGVTLALDFANHGPRTHELFQRLDAIVLEAKGRLYPAKDARMSSSLFEAGYPNLNEFVKYRDPGISSALSRRLMGY